MHAVGLLRTNDFLRLRRTLGGLRGRHFRFKSERAEVLIEDYDRLVNWNFDQYVAYSLCLTLPGEQASLSYTLESPKDLKNHEVPGKSPSFIDWDGRATISHTSSRITTHAEAGTNRRLLSDLIYQPSCH